MKHIIVWTELKPSSLPNGEEFDAGLHVRKVYPQYRWRFVLSTDNMPNDFTLADAHLDDEMYIVVDADPNFPTVMS